MDATAPAPRDTPTIHPHVFELADILADAWESIDAQLTLSGVPLNRVEPPADPGAPTDPTPAPEGTPAAPEINWEQRYNDLRPKFDQTAQEAAQLRAAQAALDDEETRRQLMAQWGYEVDEPAAETLSDADELRQQIAELNQWKTSTTAAQQEQQQLRQIEASVDEQFRAAAPDLDPATREWVTTKALSMPPREDGMPDINAAHKAFTDWAVEQQKQWARTKRRAPFVPPGGTAGTNAPDLDKMTPSQLAEYMAQEVMARDAA